LVIYTISTLFLNNLTNPFTNISFFVNTKCAIFYNLSHTTNITSFSATNSNLVIKSTIKYVYSFSSTLLSTYLLVPLSCSLSFDTNCISLHISPYSYFLLITSNHSSPTLLSSISFCIQLLAYYSVIR